MFSSIMKFCLHFPYLEFSEKQEILKIKITCSVLEWWEHSATTIVQTYIKTYVNLEKTIETTLFGFN